MSTKRLSPEARAALDAVRRGLTTKSEVLEQANLTFMESVLAALENLDRRVATLEQR